MGLKNNLKQCIMRKVMKKRKADQTFDEVASELHTLAKDADETINSSYYFASHDKDGNAYFFRLGHRGGVGGKNHVAEIWFGYMTSTGEAFMNSKELYPIEKSPAHAKCIEPLRHWEFSFKGKMTPVVAGEDLIAKPCGDEVDVEFHGTFKSENGLFEFARDTNIKSYSNAIAAEKWVKGFSDELKKNHQTRIEQVGHTDITFKVGGKKYGFSAMAIRDQAHGRRIWSYMNHYGWLVGNLEDGRSFNTVMVLYPPINVKGLKTGYVLVNGEYISLIDVGYPKEFTTKGVAPTSGNVPAKFADKSKAQIEFQTKILFPYQFTDAEGGYDVFEGITTFNYNGVQGYGIAEFSYNRDKFRYETAFTHKQGVKKG